MGIGIETLGIDTDLLQPGHGLALRLFLADRQMRHDGLDQLITNRAQRIQAGERILEHHADALAANAIGRAHVELVDALVLEPYFAILDVTRRIDQPDNRSPGHRLAGTRFTHKAENLALLNIKGYVVDRNQLAVSMREYDPQVFDAKNRIAHLSLGLSVSRNQSPSRLTDNASASSVTAGNSRIHHSPENR